jgi:hypothetical protein
MAIVSVGTGSIGASQSVQWEFWWPNVYNGPMFVQAEPLFVDIKLEISELAVTHDSARGTWVYSFTLINKGPAPTNYNLFACSF